MFSTPMFKPRHIEAEDDVGPAPTAPGASDATVARRRNVLALFQAYAEDALARGVPPKGLEQRYAEQLQISPSMWSQIKSSRPIGDRLARQIENHAGKPAGWLDEARELLTPTPAEKAFLDLALAVYRSAGAGGRRELRHALQQRLDQAGQAAPEKAAAPAKQGGAAPRRRERAQT